MPEAVAHIIADVVHRVVASQGLAGAELAGWPRAVATQSDCGKVLTQMAALGLVEARHEPPFGTKWFATPYGIKTGSRLLAVKRAQPA